MTHAAFTAALGGLFHELGLLESRVRLQPGSRQQSCPSFSGLFSGNKDLLTCIRSRASELSYDAAEADSSVWAVVLADRILSGTKRGKELRLRPLYSLFGTMKQEYGKYAYPLRKMSSDCISMPEKVSEISVGAEDYLQILRSLESSLSSAELSEDYIDGFLSVLEQHLSFVPVGEDGGENGDISLFDHVKMTAAFASCIAEICEERGTGDLRKLYYSHADAFAAEKNFLLYTCDMSGIQNFIYNISSAGALKSLRSRSFALELLMEHFIDELLDACGLSRANLIYSGGGHAYILLPDTEKVRSACTKSEESMKMWLMNRFGTALYLASAWVECSADDLMNRPGKEIPYKRIFSELGRRIADRKFRRYTASELMLLNHIELGGGSRECVVCGRSSHLIEDESLGTICPDCRLFVEMGKILPREGLVWILADRTLPESLLTWELPGTTGKRYMNFQTFSSDGQLQAYIEKNAAHICRVYTKNRFDIMVRYGHNLWMGDYLSSPGSSLEDILDEDMQEKERGIRRTAVCRADVDGLGRAFCSGFENAAAEKYEERYRFLNISRTAAFSRMMSVFFRYYINLILNGSLPQYGFSLEDKLTGAKKVNIVYAGGDDVFLIGVWDDILESAVSVRDAFDRYCCGALTISAGIGIFGARYPVSAEAQETALLEENAKHYEEDGLPKNAVCLFRPADDFTFRWGTFRKGVIDEKMKQIRELIEYPGNPAENIQRGKAMLYHLLEFLNAAEQKINIARYAYLLTRLEPSGKNSAYHAVYRTFASRMYQWILDDNDRKELIAAITLYVYMTRTR